MVELWTLVIIAAVLNIGALCLEWWQRRDPWFGWKVTLSDGTWSRIMKYDPTTRVATVAGWNEMPVKMFKGGEDEI